MHAKKLDDEQNIANAERVNAGLMRGQFNCFVSTYPKFFAAALQMWRERGRNQAVASVMLWYDENGDTWLEPDGVTQ